MKKNVIIVIGIAIISMVFSACSILPEATAESAEPTAVVTQVEQELNVISDGRIVPNQEKLVAFLSGGEVAEVLVEKGDEVSAGQVLARLANQEQAQANVAAAELELASAQQARDELVRLEAVSRDQAWQVLIDARQALIAASRAWEEIDTVDTQDAIDEAEVEVADRKADLDDAQDEYDKYTDLPEDNTTREDASDELEQAQKDYDEAVRARDELVNQRDRAEADLAAAQSSLAEAQKSYDDLQAGPDPDALALADLRLDAAQAQLDAALAVFDSFELKAPIAGTVVDVNIVDGQMVSPGLWAFHVADFSTWYVETTDLTELEVVRIQPGQQATIIPDALKDLELTGMVQEISQVPGVQSGDVVYEVRISLDELDPLLRWGMTVEVSFAE